MILLHPSEDRFHALDAPGSYEWTYFDGLSEDGGEGFTAIWFRGIPMSPWYTAAIDRDPKGARPERYCAFAFGLYRAGKRIASGVEEGLEEDFFGDLNSPDARFRGNRLDSSRHQGGTTGYRIALDLRRPLSASRILGEISLQFPEHNLGDAALPYRPDDGVDFWVPVAPGGTFSAAIDLTHIGRSPDRYRFAGRAYHDRNFGVEPLHHLDLDWSWGRFHADAKTFVFFDISGDKGEGEMGKGNDDGLQPTTHRSQPFRRLLLFDGGNLVESVESFEPIPPVWKKHWATLPYPEAFGATGNGGEIRFHARTISLLDSGPFYHRMGAEFELIRAGTRMAGRGMTEYLRPSRLGLRIFRPFVKFRVQRSF